MFFLAFTLFLVSLAFLITEGYGLFLMECVVTQDGSGSHGRVMALKEFARGVSSSNLAEPVEIKLVIIIKFKLILIV